jgi:hypothetical protein
MSACPACLACVAAEVIFTLAVPQLLAVSQSQQLPTPPPKQPQMTQPGES